MRLCSGLLVVEWWRLETAVPRVLVLPGAFCLSAVCLLLLLVPLLAPTVSVPAAVEEERILFPFATYLNVILLIAFSSRSKRLCSGLPIVS